MTRPPTYGWRSPKLPLVIALALSGVLMAPTYSLSQDHDSGSLQGVAKRVRIFGYGTVAFGDTNVNHYQFGNEGGAYDHSQLAISFHSDWKQARIAAQFQMETSDEFDGTTTQIDYLFGEWRFSDKLKLRIGKARHPFGIYADIQDVGTLRPSLSLPSGVYGPTGVVAEHYTGAGLSGFLISESDWEFSYDVYAGEVVLDAAHPWEALERVGFQEDERLKVSDMVGGRLVVATPLPGFSFGASAYVGTASPQRTEEAGGGEEESAEGISGRHQTAGLQAEYQGSALLLRGEYVNHDFRDRHTIDAFYLEAGYFIAPKWQLTGRYDKADVDLSKPRAIIEIGRKAPTLLEHEDLSFGVNYWFTENFVAKLEYHTVEGNFFARPIRNDLKPVVLGGELRPETDLLQVGISVSF